MEVTPKVDFAQFLLDRELINAMTAARIRQRSKTDRKPLGNILIKNGNLNIRQVMNVLEKQADEPQRRFGELAVEAGYITTVVLERALKQQQHEYRHQTEIADEEAKISDASMREALRAYVQTLELQLDEMPSLDRRHLKAV